MAASYAADMVLRTIETACLHAARIVPVRVEVDVQPGLPSFTIIGLPDKQIEEARERVRAAIRNSGFVMPMGKIVVNLAPSAIPKQGTSFDLSIAIGILATQFPKAELPRKVWLLGELSLDGTVEAFQQLVAVLAEAKRRGNKVLIPEAQVEVARVVGYDSVTVVSSLAQTWEMYSASVFPETRLRKKGASSPSVAREYLFDQVIGQERVKRAVTVALAGRHSLFMVQLVPVKQC